VHSSETGRNEFFWRKIKANTPEEWQTSTREYKNFFREEVVGRFHSPALPPNPRLRQIELPNPPTNPNAPPTCYEVVLDVFPDVFAWGYLLLPADLKPGDRRPVVVCQHGLEGVPADTVNTDTNSRAFGYYKAFALRLAEEGFV